jgi:hypothetical protein
MRQSYFPLAALAVLTMAGACTESTRSDAKFPTDPALAKGGSPECNTQVANAVDKDLKALYGNSVPTSIASAWSAVQSNCPGAAAKAAVLTYVDAMLTQENPPISDATRAGIVVSDWTTVYQYAGYTGQDVPGVSVAVLQTAGGAGVINLDVGGTVTTHDHLAAVLVPGQHRTGSVLFTIEPTTPGCFQTNLGKVGTCYEFGDSPSAEPYAPRLRFGICATTDPSVLDEHLKLRLAHQHGTTFSVLTRFPPPATVLCGDVASTSWLQKYGGPLGRLVARAAGLFVPHTLYASHGGLGGEDAGASPVGGVASQIFDADFSNDTPGTSPVSPLVGTWNTPIPAPPPSTVLVQASIGNLTDRPVVINQAGGACQHCGTLLFTGTATNSGAAPANTGSYYVEFDALQDQPSPKDGPLVSRGANGREIARVAFRNVSSNRHIWFDDQDTGTSWTTDVSLHFKITFDFDASPKTASLEINGVTVVDPRPLYAKQGAVGSDLSSLGWELTGIDAGVMGWDNVRVYRVTTP